MHIWAAYGICDIVPVDLVDRSGDELIIVRIPAHASPKVGYELKIWKGGQTKPVDLVEPFKVAGWFVTEVIGCASWRTDLLVNVSSAKPRAVAPRGEFAALDVDEPSCSLDQQEQQRYAVLRRGRVLHFDHGRYHPA